MLSETFTELTITVKFPVALRIDLFQIISERSKTKRRARKSPSPSPKKGNRYTLLFIIGINH